MKIFQDIKDIIIIDIDHLEQLDTIIHPKIPLKQIPDTGILGGIPPLYKDNILKTILRDVQTNPNYIRYIPFYLNKIINDPYYKNKNALDPTEIYHIRISRGCLNNCAHCAIVLAHRPLRSRPIEQIQTDIEQGLKKGYTIFKLVGHDVSCYGMDINTNIVELLKMFFNLPGENKIILTDINPRWFMKYYDQLEPILIANHEKIISIRIPIESGSNKILTRMNRQYQIEDVKRYVSRLKEKIPTLKIKTHVIVGYPGETEEDFQQTITVLKEIQFSYVEVYPFSNRPMTEAYKMKEKNPPEIIERRRKQAIKQLYLTK
jgi:MiaB/RimO family radical SAM methylthiotransferase